jgi:hypothetical protein
MEAFGDMAGFLSCADRWFVDTGLRRHDGSGSGVFF